MAKIRFIDKPYTSPGTPGISELSGMLKSGVCVYGLYFLCVEAVAKPRHTLEIIEGAELVKDMYANRHYRVIGIAEGKRAAFEMVRRLVEECLADGGSDGLDGYLRGLL